MPACLPAYTQRQDAIIVMEKSEPNKNQLKPTCCEFVCAHPAHSDWRFILKCWRAHMLIATCCAVLCCVSCMTHSPTMC